MLNTFTYFFIACFAILLVQTGNAQTCTGTLGAPIVNIDFGSGPNPGAALPVYKSDSRYTLNPCAESGAYSIVNSTANCYSNTWLNLPQDHTGNTNGYMMLVNPEDPNLYVDTLQLCGGTTYELAAFIINMANLAACGGGATLPNLTITIEATDGTLLAGFNTGDIPVTVSPVVWSRQAFFFTLPDMYSDVVMRLKNNRPSGGCGNDLGIDDITIRPCGLTVDAAFSNINPAPDTIRLCESSNSSIGFTGMVQSGFTSTAYQWQESTDNGVSWHDIAAASSLQLTKSFAQAGNFQYRIAAAAAGSIASARCRTVSKALIIIVDAVPVPAAANTSPVCTGSPIAFTAKTGEFYQWTGPAGFTGSSASFSIAAAALNQAGKYYVLVTTRGGCSVLDSTLAIVSSYPMADAGKDSLICAGGTASLQATGGITYSWTPAAGLSSTSIANPIASPAISTVYTVTVGNQYNCRSTDQVLITVAALPIAHAGAGTNICKGNAVTLQASGGVKYQWLPATGLSDAGIANPVATPLVATVYAVTVFNQYNCQAKDSVLIRVFTQALANAGPDKTIFEGDSVLLNGTIGGDTTDYFWTPAQFINNNRVKEPVVHPVDDITYTLHVGSASVCGIITDDVLVHVNKNLQIPNAFSPNGDGINDSWIIRGLSRFPDAEVKVFNRYGQVIFYSRGYNRPWDGRSNGNPLPAGTYYYTFDRKRDYPLLSGWVLIVR